MRPKSLLAVVLSISMLLAVCMTGHIFAADCIHSYEQTGIPATCIEKEQIVYTCRLCGDSFTVYADKPVLPDTCYILVESTKSEGRLTVTATLENNPGIYFMRMIFHYNEAALAPVSRINGDVWTDSECWTTKPPAENPFFYAAEHADMTSNNTKNGLVCTLVFDILDENADYGFKITLDKKPFIDFENNLVDVSIFDIVGKSEYGSHNYEDRTVPPSCTEDGYTQRVCTICTDVVFGETLPATGHRWSLTREIESPTFESDGLGLYTCESCKETREEALPALEHWKKGDLNNDGELTMVDLVYMRRTAGSITKDSPQMYDAADLDNDGIVTMTDFVLLVRIAGGNAPMPPGW